MWYVAAVSALPLCGILVGGKARRMGGRPKGLFAAPDSGEPLVVRLARLANELGLEVVLVGEAPAYAQALAEAPGLPPVGVLKDEPPGIGPPGALQALLGAAQGRDVLALACDLPYVTRELLERLLPPLGPGVDARAARRGPGAPWEPLLARYAPSTLPWLREGLAAGERSLQALLDRLRTEPLVLAPSEHALLDDWDEPADLLPR